MFRSCIFCHASLGANEAVENFPVGRRLAFDGDKGRLWVVCEKCGQWNLTPLEERWEAIEECERLYRETRTRVSTENIGLARLTEGLVLVRIGRPQRPEFAAWRYGDQFGRRRRKHLLLTGAGVAGVAAVAFGGPAAGLITGGTVTSLNYLFQAYILYRENWRIAAHVPLSDGERLELTPSHMKKAKVVRRGAEDGWWGLEVRHLGPGERLSWTPNGVRKLGPATVLTGADALRAARLILPRLNRGGAGKQTVRDAVRLVEEAGTPELCFADALRTKARRYSVQGDKDWLVHYPHTTLLALEMAAHEETERRALEGELAALEESWRQAEEIAKIADDMFLPPNVEKFLREKSGRQSREGSSE